MEIQIYSVSKASMYINLHLALKMHGCYGGRNLPLVNTLSGCTESHQNLQ